MVVVVHIPFQVRVDFDQLFKFGPERDVETKHITLSVIKRKRPFTDLLHPTLIVPDRFVFNRGSTQFADDVVMLGFDLTDRKMMTVDIDSQDTVLVVVNTQPLYPTI